MFKANYHFVFTWKFIFNDMPTLNKWIITLIMKMIIIIILKIINMTLIINCSGCS